MLSPFAALCEDTMQPINSRKSTVDSEIFPGTLFSLIFANSSPREFKVLADIVNNNLYLAILVSRILAREFKNS